MKVKSLSRVRLLATPWTAAHQAPPSMGFSRQCVCVLVAQSYPTLCDPHGLWPTRLFCPWDSPGKNTGGGSHFLLQGTFPTQGSNLHLLNCRKILYHLSHQGSAIAIHMSPVFFGFPSHLADHRALSSIPSAVQSVPISHRFYTEYQY